MSFIDIATLASFVGLLVTAAALDYRTRRIPNWLVLAGLAIALLLRALQGADAITAGLIGAAIGLGVGYTLFALGVFGGGDGKLLMAVGAYFGGPGAILGAFLAIALAGGALGIIWSVRAGVILPVLLNTGQTLKYLVTFGRAGSLRTGHSAIAMSVPYGLAIAAGSLIWWFWGVPIL
jgi:prepilin peptidase CpaA